MISDRKFAVISFDFDDTLAEIVRFGYSSEMLICIPKILDLLKEYHALGCKCLILTARTPKQEHIDEINGFLRQMKIEGCISEVVFTSHQPKGPFAFRLGVNLHYDDDETHLNSIREFGIQAICSK